MKDPILDIPFSGGLDESIRPEHASPTKAFTVLQNVRQDSIGSVSKRLGYASLGLSRLDGTSRSAGSRMFCHRDVIGVIDGTYLDTYSASSAVSVTRGRVPEASVTMRPTATYAASVEECFLQDVAVCGNYAAYAYSASEIVGTDQNSVVVHVEDVVSGVTLKSPEVLFSTAALGFGAAVCALASYSTYFIAIAFDSAVGEVFAWYLNTASAATITTGWVSIGQLGSGGTDLHDISGNGVLSLSTQSLSNRVAVAYVNASAGASQVTVKTVTIAGVAETATVNTSSVTPTTVAVEGSASDTLWVAWNETTSVKLKGLTATSLSTVLATTATILTLNTAEPLAIGIASSSTAGQGRIIATDGGNDRVQMRGFQTSAGAAATNGSQSTVPNAMIGSRPFRVGTRYYVLAAPAPGSATNSQRSAALVDWTDGNTWLRPLANLAPSLAVFPGQLGVHRCHVESIGSSRYVTGLSVVSSSASFATKLVTFDFADRKRWRAVSHNGATLLSGGMLSCFDGSRVAEAGFVVRPPKPTTANAGGSGATGTFRYVLVYEQADAAGNWHISSVSDPSDSRTVTDDAITVTLRPLSITGRQASAGADVRLSIYRTGVNGEAPYYLLTSLPNTTSAATVTYSDTTTDITANRLLLGTGNLPATNGAAQDRRAPPHCQDIESYSNMLVVASGSVLWWSGQAIDGEGVWFSPAFTVQVEGDGDIVAIRAQDGTLYVFKRRAIWAVSGDAPADNGSSGGLGTPRRLAADVGCIDPASVVVTSMGIFFQSERGPALLGRDGAVTFIGDAVQATFASYPVVSSAVLDDRNGLVRLSLAASESSGRVSGNGRDLVYDLAVKQWQSVDDKTGASAHEASQDACMVYVGGAWRYAWLGTDGTVRYERLPDDASAHLDGSSWVTQKASTPWLHLGGLQGEQNIDRILALFEQHTGHDLTISVYRDYVDSSPETKTFTAAQIAALTRQWLDRELITSTSQAIRIVIEDATPSSGSVGTGKGATWVGLTLSGEVHRGVKRTTSAQRGGS